ncbi:dermonecrotic toxin domain-containing protein [Burkholderia sp. AW49-1]
MKISGFQVTATIDRFADHFGTPSKTPEGALPALNGIRTKRAAWVDVLPTRGVSRENPNTAYVASYRDAASETPGARASMVPVDPKPDEIFATNEDRVAFIRIRSDFQSRPAPDARGIARDFIRHRLGVDGDKYILAHFKTAQARAEGKPDETMSLTDAVMHAFPGVSDQGLWPTVELVTGELLGGGEASPSAAGFVNGVFHSEDIGDFFKRLGSFLWSRTGPGYIYNTFIAPGNVRQTRQEHIRPIDDAFGIYLNNGKVFSDANLGDLRPSSVADAFKADGLSELPYIKRLNEVLNAYWDCVQNDWPLLARHQFVQQVRAARDEGKLSEAEYRLAMKAGAPGVPFAGRITLEQLRQSSKPDVSVRVERLTLDGYSATDIVRFIAPDDSEVMYIPGRQPPFASIGAGRLHEWLKDEVEDPARASALLAHFSMYDKQDGTFYAGITADLKALAKGEHKKIEFDRAPIDEDVFDDMRDRVGQRVRSDANVQTRTAWEGWRHVLNRSSAMLGPLGAPLQLSTGLDQAVNGKSKEERDAGMVQTEDAALAIVTMKLGHDASGDAGSESHPNWAFKPPVGGDDGLARESAGSPRSLGASNEATRAPDIEMEVREAQSPIDLGETVHPGLADLSRQPGMENVEFMTGTAVRILAQENVASRVGGSVAARAYGAPRYPVDIDLELGNPADWRRAYDALVNTSTDVTMSGRRARVTGEGVPDEFVDGEGGVVRLRFEFDDGQTSEVLVDISNENNSIFNRDLRSPQVRGVQARAGQVELLQPADLVFNYLSRIVNNPERATAKGDEQQIIGLLRRAGFDRGSLDSRLRIANSILERVKPEVRATYRDELYRILNWVG